MAEDTQTCLSCKEPIKTESIDIWVSVTIYDKDQEPVKTGEQIEMPYMDYLVVCPNCKDKFQQGWYNLIDHLLT